MVCYSCNKQEPAALPDISFYIEVKGCQNDSCMVYFYDNSKNINSRKWDFGNGDLSILKMDSSNYYQGSSYNVTLEVRNTDGITVNESKKLTF
jgi:PKD repeat protein